MIPRGGTPKRMLRIDLLAEAAWVKLGLPRVQLVHLVHQLVIGEAVFCIFLVLGARLEAFHCPPELIILWFLRC